MATATFEEKLINAVWPRRYLYDKRHPNHCKRKVINKAWLEIANEVKKPDNLCKKRWRSLKDRFYTLHRENKQKISNGDNNGENFISWPFYHSLGFLANLNSTRNSTGSGITQDISLIIPELQTGIDSSNMSSEQNSQPNSPPSINNTIISSFLRTDPTAGVDALNTTSNRNKHQLKRTNSLVVDKSGEKVSKNISLQSHEDTAMCLQYLQKEYSSSNSCFSMFIRHELDVMTEEEQDEFKFGIMDLLQDIKTARRRRIN